MDTDQLQKQLAEAQAMIKKQAERIADLEMLTSAKLGLDEMPESGTTSSPKPSTVSVETEQDAEVDRAFASSAPPPPRTSRYSVLK
ncbi:hypothetical protein [Caudoviricetes sp.]|nr:hypothetical protein [Caudoviricetes sp.]